MSPCREAQDLSRRAPAQIPECIARNLQDAYSVLVAHKRSSCTYCSSKTMRCSVKRSRWPSAAALQSGEAGKEIEGPMAIVILGGLVTSTALNLLVLPALALRCGKFRKREGDLISVRSG